MAKVKVLTAREVGIRMDLPHTEVIRRIRRGDIEASKLGWFWIVEEGDMVTAMQSDWYLRIHKAQPA
jgi:hypothetical protein